MPKPTKPPIQQGRAAERFVYLGHVVRPTRLVRQFWSNCQRQTYRQCDKFACVSIFEWPGIRVSDSLQERISVDLHGREVDQRRRCVRLGCVTRSRRRAPWNHCPRRFSLSGPTEGLLRQICSPTTIKPAHLNFIQLKQRKGDDGIGEGNFEAVSGSIESDPKRCGALNPF